jgi:endo-1,3(4)-beta-glucanase
MAITHIEESQRVYGKPDNRLPGSPASYMINPVGIQSVIMSAMEFSNQAILTTDSLQTFSVNANLLPNANSKSSIRFPLVQGMGFVTGLYTNLQPAIRSGVFFETVTRTGSPSKGIFKYQIKLADGRVWLLYVVPKDGKRPFFSLTSQTLLQGPRGFSGTIQVSKDTGNAVHEKIIDGSAGIWANGASLSGSVVGTKGSYTLRWGTGGDTRKKLLMYSLPHHQSSFNTATKAAMTGIVLSTTTKGNATAVLGNSWTMVEAELPTDIGFLPMAAKRPDGARADFSNSATSLVASAAKSELGQNIAAQTNLDSFYYAGKALSKFAAIIWAARTLANSPDITTSALSRLEQAFAIFASNQNKFPLVYDTAWKGVVSSAWNDSGADFGNSFYNDHHFHFGYFLHAAAMIGSLDPAWAQENKDYINTLVRDVSNPSEDDKYFPVFRNYDWFHGHSWAKGLFESGDSKDEESSSEDVMFAYGLKMWGKTVGDRSMEARGNLMLAVLKRSLNSYFLMASDNKIQPANFIGNKVTGIVRSPPSL